MNLIQNQDANDLKTQTLKLNTFFIQNEKNEQQNSVLVQILKLISAAAAKGEYSITYNFSDFSENRYTDLDDFLIEKLTNAGFDVETEDVDDWNEPNTLLISWAPPYNPPIES